MKVKKLIVNLLKIVALILFVTFLVLVATSDGFRQGFEQAEKNRMEEIESRY